jgi:hypothetical protein
MSVSCFVCHENGSVAGDVALPPGTSKTVFAPQADRLVALAVSGGGETVEIAFLLLDGPDQIGFRPAFGLDMVSSGNGAQFLQLHGHFSRSKIE